MTTAYDAPHDELEGPYWNATRIGMTVALVLMVIMWGWIFIFSSRDNPDRLTDSAFPVAAEAACAPAQAAVGLLPPGNTATTPQERAVQVRTGTDITIDLVASLKQAAAAVSDVDDSRLLEAWFADWDAYIADREAYIVKLEAATDETPNTDLVFTLQERASGGVYTRRIDGFGNVNAMTSCHVPGDI